MLSSILCGARSSFVRAGSASYFPLQSFVLPPPPFKILFPLFVRANDRGKDWIRWVNLASSLAGGRVSVLEAPEVRELPDMMPPKFLYF